MRIDIHTPCVRCGATVAESAAYCPTCGFAQPVGQALEPTDPPTGPSLLPTHPSPVALISLLATVLAVLVITLPVLTLRWAFFGPDDSVRNYYAALADRDADAAWQYVLADNVTRSAYPTLGRRALRDPGYTPPSKVRISAVRTDGAKATAQVSYELAGSAYAETVDLKRLGGPDHSLRRWYLENALRGLPVSAGEGVVVSVAGNAIAVSGRGNDVPVFPGRYVVGLPDNPMLEADPVTVTAGASESVALSPRLRSTIVQQIDQQVRQYLDGCAAKTELAPAGCPFGATSYYDVTSVSWRITRYPTLTYRLGEDFGVVVVGTASNGSAQVNARTTSTYSPTLSDEQPFSVSGNATVSGGTVAFTPTP
jgi:hypothetical protein